MDINNPYNLSPQELKTRRAESLAFQAEREKRNSEAWRNIIKKPIDPKITKESNDNFLTSLSKAGYEF